MRRECGCLGPGDDRGNVLHRRLQLAAAAAATRTAEDANVRTAPKVRPKKPARNRREKSGIPALDKDLPDTETEGESAAERDDDDDDMSGFFWNDYDASNNAFTRMEAQSKENKPEGDDNTLSRQSSCVH